MRSKILAVCYDCNGITTRADHRLAAVRELSPMKGIRATYYAYLCEDCAHLRSLRAGRPCTSFGETQTSVVGFIAVRMQAIIYTGCRPAVAYSQDVLSAFQPNKGSRTTYHFVQALDMVWTATRSPATRYPPLPVLPYPNDMVTENFEKIAVCRLLRLTIY